MRKLVCISVLLALCACTPAVPRLTIEVAQDFCKKKIKNQMISEASFGVGEDREALGDPKVAHAKCVKKYSGQDPTAPLAG